MTAQGTSPPSSPLFAVWLCCWLQSEQALHTSRQYIVNSLLCNLDFAEIAKGKTYCAFTPDYLLPSCTGSSSLHYSHAARAGLRKGLPRFTCLVFSQSGHKEAECCHRKVLTRNYLLTPLPINLGSWANYSESHFFFSSAKWGGEEAS